MSKTDYSAPMDEAGLTGIDLYTAGKFRSTAPLPGADLGFKRGGAHCCQ